MSSTSIEELLRAATSEADAVAARELALLALWIEQAQKTTVDLSEILGPARRARIAYALGTAQGEAMLALRAQVERDAKTVRV